MEIPLFVHLIVWIIGIPVIAVLLVSIARRTRAIRAEDRRLKEEAEQAASRDPYAAIAQMYAATELLDRAAGRGGKPRA